MADAGLVALIQKERRAKHRGGDSGHCVLVRTMRTGTDHWHVTFVVLKAVSVCVCVVVSRVKVIY